MKRWFSKARFSIPFVTLGLIGGAGCALQTDVDLDEPIAKIAEALSFGGWTRIQSKTFSYAPAIVTRTFSDHSQRTDVVAAIGDGTVYYNSRPTGSTSWQGWSGVPNGVIASKPAITAFPVNGSPKVIVAGRGTDGAIYVNAALGMFDAFGSWQKVAPPGGASSFVGAPAIVYRHPSLLIFARKSNKKIYWTASADPTGGFISWTSAWQEIPGGLLESEPAAVVISQGNIAVVAQGGDNRYWMISGNPQNWTTWSPISSSTTFISPPGIAFRGSLLDVFGRRSDQTIWQSTINPSNPTVATFTQIPETMGGAPGAFARDSTHVDVVVRGLNEKVYINSGTQ